MEGVLKANVVNQITKGSIIFKENESITFICMVIKGKVNAYAKGSKITLGSGSFLGVFDAYMNRYICTYEAIEDLTVFAFPAEGVETVKAIASMNKDYRGIMVCSLCKQIAEYGKIRDSLSKCATDLFSFLIRSYESYYEIGAKLKAQLIPIPSLISLEPFTSLLEANEKKLTYYTECSKIPLDTQKTYYSYLDFVTMFHIEEASGLLAQMVMECMELSNYIEESFSALMNDGETNLYRVETMLALELKKKGIHNDELMQLIDSSVDQMNHLEKSFELNTGHALHVNRVKVEKLYTALLTGNEEHLEGHEQEEKRAEEEATLKRNVKSLTRSLDQILLFSEIKKEEEQKLRAAIHYIIISGDRMSVDDDMRRVKKEIASIYYRLYYNACLKSFHTTNLPKAVELFLDYGFLDERLLEESQIFTLCNMKFDESEGPCKIYTIREWLKKIYLGEKDTSKNEFDEDYATTLRNERKKGSITEEEERNLYQNMEKRLEFEIKNMFTTNNRLVNGQLYTFVPILYKEMFIGAMEKLKLTKQKINAVVQKLLRIDYSIFHREILYCKPELRINKEYIIKQIFPNIILMPTVGMQASMWQEVLNRKKDTPARFIFPMFTDGNIEDIMIKMFARYRWEICRNIQGGSWNNIKDKSLTSEYVDYIQFYRRNHDLSEEKKEKIKLQIQKGRNNTREIFLIDYEAWIKSEAVGAIKLNKYVREILATYCPFSEPIRRKLSYQPIFEEAMARFKREKAKKIHDLELRYHALQKEGIRLTKELEDTMSFYREQ